VPAAVNETGVKMIQVTRLNDSVLMVNVDRIQSLQAIPETVITFTNNDKIMVKEPLEEVSQRIVEYQRTISTNSKTGACLRPDPN
jgi:flagellar protein FlbD